MKKKTKTNINTRSWNMKPALSIFNLTSLVLAVISGTDIYVFRFWQTRCGLHLYQKEMLILQDWYYKTIVICNVDGGSAVADESYVNGLTRLHIRLEKIWGDSGIWAFAETAIILCRCTLLRRRLDQPIVTDIDQFTDGLLLKFTQLLLV